MTDEFTARFGQLDIGPRHPNNPDDPSLSLYDVHSLARRYDFESEPGNAWAIDVKTRERVFRIDVDGRTFLPSGKEIATPKLTPRAAPPSAADKLYGKPKPAPGRPTLVDSAAKLAARLYGPKWHAK